MIYICKFPNSIVGNMYDKVGYAEAIGSYIYRFNSYDGNTIGLHVSWLEKVSLWM